MRGLTELSKQAASELHGWRPELGVFSVYVAADPADVGGRREIELRNGLREAIEAVVATGADRDLLAAAKATAQRIERFLLGEGARPPARGTTGFVEVAREPGVERWYKAHTPPRRTEVTYGQGPYLAPLLSLLDDGAPFGVAAVSAERVRLFHTQLGQTEELADWEFEVLSGDWRERKAPRASDRGAGTMVSSAGRDQHEQRLEASRQRFSRETGALARAVAADQDWRELVVFGDDRYVTHFEDSVGDRCPIRHLDQADLVPEPTQKIAERIERLSPTLNRERELALVERIEEAAHPGGRGVMGTQKTLEALEQGRVGHLLYDAELDGASNERLIELALSCGAAITPAEGEAAARLADHDGVAALLRY